MVEILGVVGCDSQAAFGFEAAEDVDEICVGDEASFMVAFFRPGVRKVNVKTIDGIIGQEIGQQMGGVISNEADVGEVPAADAVDCEAVKFTCPFDAEEVGLGCDFGLVEQKRGLSGADFDVEGAAATENLTKIELLAQVFGL